jgi:hypothetical protein
MPSKNPNNHATRFKPQDGVVKVRLQPIGAKLPPEIDEIVRRMANRSAFIRRAVVNQLFAEGYLSLPEITPSAQVHEDTIATSPPPAKKTRAGKKVS